MLDEVRTEDIGEAADGRIPKETYDKALSGLVMSHTVFRKIANSSSKKDILKAIKLAYVGGDVPRLNRDKILTMCQNLVNIMECVVVCKGYEMQNEQNEGEEDE